ncbi:MAG: hypothetical protein Q9224_003540 [Gallowayella concinna]
MLRDLPFFIYESKTIPMNQKLWSVSVHATGEVMKYKSDAVDQHEVFILFMYTPGNLSPDLDRYALDLTHAQYGHDDETLMPWKTYVETRVISNSGQKPLGWTRERSKRLMVEHFGFDGLKLQIIAEGFGDATTAAIRERTGWRKMWKEPDEILYQRQVEQVKQHVADRLERFVTSKANEQLFKLWDSASMKTRMETAAKQARLEKLESWGHDYRGKAFGPTMEMVAARQAKERERWGTPDDERKKVERKQMNMMDGSYRK